MTARGEGQQKSFRFPKGIPQRPVLEAGQVEFGRPLPKRKTQSTRRRLTVEETGPGFFTDPSLRNPNVLRVTLNPEIPVNYVWVKAGSFSTGPLDSDAEDYAGTLRKRARIVSLGKTLDVRRGSFTGTIVEVKDADDRRFLGMSGWWGKNQLSDEAEEILTEKPTF